MKPFALAVVLAAAGCGASNERDAAVPSDAAPDARTGMDVASVVDSGSLSDGYLGEIPPPQTDVVASGGSGDSTGDQYLPWAGGAAYYRRFTHGPSSDPAFFPITVWLQSPANAARYAALGVNLFVGQYNDPSAHDLATLADAHVAVACDQDSTTLPLASDPALVMWTQQDEPDNAQDDGHGGYGPCITPAALTTRYDTMHSHDATRPVFLSFGQGVAYTTWIGRGTCTGDLGYYGTAAAAGDVLSFDVYPANGTDHAVAGNLYLVADGVDRLRADAHDMKPVWNWIETTRIDSSGGPGPTPAQTRSEVWMSIVHGAMGIGYFAHRITPFDETGLLDDGAMRSAVGAIDAQIAMLAPVLNTQSLANGATVTSSNTAVPVDILVKRHDGALYVLATAMRSGSTTATFTIRGAPARGSVEVLGESRTLTVGDGSFHDAFDAYAAHLYRVTY